MKRNEIAARARVLRVDTSQYRRVIAVSDTHGNGYLLKRLLGELSFSKEDALFLLGDFIERGRDSLATVRLAMELCRAGNAFALQGNCDTLWDDLAAGVYGVDLNAYVDWRRNSLIADMCAEQGMDRSRISPGELRAALDDRYGAIFAWLRGLPHIIDTREAVFVHAGIDAGSLTEQSAERCLRREAFLEEELRFEKTVVCGHIPTCNYFHMTGNRYSFLPLTLRDKNMIAIDGGNAVKKYGQLNALVLEGGRISFVYVDDLPEAVVRGDQAGSLFPAAVAWNHREVEFVEERGENTLCRVLFTGKLLEIPKNKLYEVEGKLCSDDYTDYMPPLRTEDRVKLLEIGEKRSLIKANGIVGWADNRILT
ncbi:MAG TPA: metallophosphoesterase [Clostridia bacterium]|nr:metallophosphoesterase [Clostridia bacterium]